MVKRVEITTVNGLKFNVDVTKYEIKNIDTLVYFMTDKELKTLQCEDGSRVKTQHVVSTKEIPSAEKEG